MTLPGLTTGNTGTESMTDCAAVEKTMENLNKIVAEFREANMKKKLKECDGLRTLAFQHSSKTTTLKETRYGINL